VRGPRTGRPGSPVPRKTYGDSERRSSRPPQQLREDRPPAPEIDPDVTMADLDRQVRGRLRGLSKENAEKVGLHLVMAGRLLDSDPELAYEHAAEAVRRAGRIDIVREAAGITAYRTGRFAEALRELRTVRRLNGSSEHLPLMADCERGLGRPERAIDLAHSPEAKELDEAGKVELAIVVSGARLDLGDAEAALATLAHLESRDRVVAARVAQARASALEALGRGEDAQAALAGFSEEELRAASGETEEELVVVDLAELDDEDGPTEEAPPRGAEGAVAEADATPGPAQELEPLEDSESAPSTEETTE